MAIIKSIIEKKYEQLFRDNYARLYYCSWDILDNAEQAKDVVSDVFMHVWEHPDRRTFIATVVDNPSLLYAMVRNRSIDVLRRNKMIDQHRQVILATEQKLDDDDYRQTEQRLEQMTAAMAQLPPQTQNVFRLCYLEEKSYKEAAEQLGVSVSAIHKHIVKGFAKFRTLLKEQSVT